jgi:hypothetical protein
MKYPGLPAGFSFPSPLDWIPPYHARGRFNQVRNDSIVKSLLIHYTKVHQAQGAGEGFILGLILFLVDRQK